MKNDPLLEEVLEVLWVMREQGGADAEGRFSREETCRILAGVEAVSAREEECGAILERLEAAELVRCEGARFVWTREGEEAARGVVRRHRLAELLLSEVFAIAAERIESDACNFEHILSPEVTESICAFLGHPPVCPHGRPIPSGACCGKFSSGMRPLVVPLRDLHAGDTAKIVFISTKDSARMEKLGLYGIMPDHVVTLKQKQPTFIVQCGETDLALDSEIKRDIFVRKVS